MPTNFSFEGEVRVRADESAEEHVEKEQAEKSLQWLQALLRQHSWTAATIAEALVDVPEKKVIELISHRAEELGETPYAIEFYAMLCQAALVMTPKEFAVVTQIRSRLFQKLINQVQAGDAWGAELLRRFHHQEKAYEDAEKCEEKNSESDISSLLRREERGNPQEKPELQKTSEADPSLELAFRLKLLLAEIRPRSESIRKTIVALNEMKKDDLVCEELQAWRERARGTESQGFPGMKRILVSFSDILTQKEQAIIGIWEAQEAEVAEARRLKREKDDQEYVKRLAEEERIRRRVRIIRRDFPNCLDQYEVEDPTSTIENILNEVHAMNREDVILEILEGYIEPLPGDFEETLKEDDRRWMKTWIKQRKANLAGIEEMKRFASPNEAVLMQEWKTLIEEKLPIMEARYAILAKDKMLNREEDTAEFRGQIDDALRDTTSSTFEKFRKAFEILHRFKREDAVCDVLQERIGYFRDWAEDASRPFADEKWRNDQRMLLDWFSRIGDVLTPEEAEIAKELVRAIEEKLHETGSAQEFSVHREYLASLNRRFNEIGRLPEVKAEKAPFISQLESGNFGHVKPLLETKFGRRWFDDDELRNATQKGVNKAWETKPALRKVLEGFIEDFELSTPELPVKTKKSAKK